MSSDVAVAAPFRVLILSPSLSLVKEVCELLAEAAVGPVTIVSAPSLDEADAALQEIAPGAVFVDIAAPDNGGLGGIVRLQAMAPTVPIVPVLGSMDPSVMRAAPIAARSSAWRLDRGAVLRCVRGAAQQQEHARQLFRLATHDPLTGLANRYLLEQRLDRALARARRTGVGGALIFIDLDDFKRCNDEHGHKAGDQVLVEVGKRLRHTVRATDTVARYGGDEFVVVLESMSEPDRVVRLVESFRAALREPLKLEDMTLAVGCSVGSACFPEEGDQAEALLALADRRMYLGKPGGEKLSVAG